MHVVFKKRANTVRPYDKNTIIHNTIKTRRYTNKNSLLLWRRWQRRDSVEAVDGRGGTQKDLITSSVGYADTFPKGEGYFSYL